MKELTVEFGAITRDNIEQLRKINTISFPIRYQESFYQETLQQNEDICKFAYWNGFVVGAICARRQTKEGVVLPATAQTTDPPPQEQQQQQQQLYIMTLAVLAPYRGRTIGKQLLQSILDYATQDAYISEISLHVHVNNRDALHFYQKFDFQQGDMIENYYKHIDPPHGYPLVKHLPGKQDS